MADITPVLNGFTLQGSDSFGAVWSTSVFDGWWDSPGSTGSTAQNAWADGGWIDEAFLQPRTLVAGGLVRGADRPSTRQAIDRLLAAIPVRTLAPLSVMEDGLSRSVRVRQEHKPVISWLSDTLASWNVQLTAPDPRRFSGDGVSAFTYSASTGLPSTTGGLTLPLTAPFSIGATVTSGSVTVTNQGNATPPVRVTFTGPVVNPILRTTTGGYMAFNITLDAGQTLVVDLDKRTVKINGTVNRRNVMSGSWITPAAGTVLMFDSTTYNSAAQMSVQWSDAWS